MSILDQVAVNRRRTSYRPTTIRQLFVLRLAQKLGEPGAVTHYAELARRHTDETLLLAYRRALNRGRPPRDLARRFHQQLLAAKEQDNAGEAEQLLSIKVERRSIAIAKFVGTRLDYHEVRHLSSIAEKAQSSAISFLTWVLDNFEFDSVAAEQMSHGDEIRRSVLNQAVLAFLRDNGLPVWEVGRPDLLLAFAHPPLRSRQELREICRDMLWGMFTRTPDSHEIDAAAVGLYVQIERQFHNS
jgi:hypothetical protein